MHANAKAGKVVEMERTWTVDEHVGATADGRGKAEGDAEHERHDKRHGVATHNLGLLIHDGEEHCGRTYIADKLADDRGENAHHSHNDIGMALTQIEYRMGHGIGDTGLGDSHREHHGDSKNEQQIPLDILGDVSEAATATQHHEAGSKHGDSHEGQHMEQRHDEHEHQNEGRGDGLGAQLGHEMTIEEGELTMRLTL